MKVSELNSRERLRPTKVPLRAVPHITIEPGMACNLRCISCYNKSHDYTKSPEDVKAEIDFAIRKRKLETITIVGGEPTLYPHLCELVSYIRSKGLICQLLTNGVILTTDKGDALLDRLIRSGLNRIVLHIDSGQGRSEAENEKMCRKLFSKLETRQLTFALAVTVNGVSQNVVPQLMKRYAPFRYFDGILVTQAKDMERVGVPFMHPGPDLSEINSDIERELSIHPASYIPSSLDDNEVCWLMYFYYYNINTGLTFHTSATLSRAFRSLYRLVKRREFFAETLDPRYSRWSFGITAAAEILINPGRIRSLIRFLRSSGRTSAVRFHYILLQSGPSFNVEKQKTQICYHCPDATIRNGRITPVCIADQINPLGRNGNETDIDRELYQTVYEHLEQL